jgi:predicted nucleotidyltransferase
MQLKHYPVRKLTNQVKQIVSEELRDMQPYVVFFFGSRVTGINTDRSDIDIGIEATECIPPHVIGEIQERLNELPMLYSVDVVDFKSVDERFYKLASQKREFIH